MTSKKATCQFRNDIECQWNQWKYTVGQQLPSSCTLKNCIFGSLRTACRMWFNRGIPNRYNSLLFHFYLMSETVNKLCTSSVENIPPSYHSLSYLNKSVYYLQFDTITSIILIHRCPIECPAVLHAGQYSQSDIISFRLVRA